MLVAPGVLSLAICHPKTSPDSSLTLTEQECVITQDCKITKGEDNLEAIWGVLPEHFVDALMELTRLPDLIEITMDLGWPPMICLAGEMPRVMKLTNEGDEVMLEDLEQLLATTTGFDSENR